MKPSHQSPLTDSPDDTPRRFPFVFKLMCKYLIWETLIGIVLLSGGVGFLLIMGWQFFPDGSNWPDLVESSFAVPFAYFVFAAPIFRLISYSVYNLDICALKFSERCLVAATIFVVPLASVILIVAVANNLKFGALPSPWLFALHGIPLAVFVAISFVDSRKYGYQIYLD